VRKFSASGNEAPAQAPLAFGARQAIAWTRTGAGGHSDGRNAVTDTKLSLPLARRIIVDGLFASAADPHAYAYRTTFIGFYLAPKEQIGRVHDYRFDEPKQTFFVFDALGDPVARVYLKEDEWIAGMSGVGELPFHFGGAKLLLASLTP